jgi:hypothetical protein
MIVAKNRLGNSETMGLMKAPTQNDIPIAITSVIVTNFKIEPARGEFEDLGCGYVLNGEELNEEITETTKLRKCFIGIEGVEFCDSEEPVPSDKKLLLKTAEDGWPVLFCIES